MKSIKLLSLSLLAFALLDAAVAQNCGKNIGASCGDPTEPCCSSYGCPNIFDILHCFFPTKQVRQHTSTLSNWMRSSILLQQAMRCSRRQCPSASASPLCGPTVNSKGSSNRQQLKRHLAGHWAYRHCCYAYRAYFSQ